MTAKVPIDELDDSASKQDQHDECKECRYEVQ